MKKMLVLLPLLLVSSAYAQSTQGRLHIRLSNWGSMADVQIMNQTPRHFSCSGPVTFHTSRGRENHFISEFVWSGHTSFRTLYPVRFNDRILQARHSIRCQPSR